LRAFLLIPFVLGCFALPPHARAVCQEGCLTNGNTVLGDDALLNNTGTDNTAIGFQALLSNTTGSFNTAIGAFALQDNTTGTTNTAIGAFALQDNTTGIRNTAIGSALTSNVTGDGNTAIGFGALASNTNGDFNTAIGVDALSPTIGSGNIAIGWRAGTNHATGDHNIYIGSEGTASESNTIRIGRNPFNPSGATTATFIQGISGATVPTGVAVIVDTNGHLGTTTSSARFKEAIKPMDKASEAILALKPVTFRFKKELDPDAIPQFGLVAEEVEKVNPDLVARDADGKAYTVRYEAVNTMLLNEFLKEHRKVEEQERKIESQQREAQKHGSQIAKQDRKVEELKATVAELKSAFKAQAAQIQKVSDQLELSKPARRIVSDH